MKMNYSNGQVVNADNFSDALHAVWLNYPEAVAYQDGSQVDEDDDVRCNGRILIWACEADSVNDDGANAIAEIATP